MHIRNIFVSFMFFVVINMYSSDCPIIFAHGHNSAADTSALNSWRTTSSAMNKILSESYRSYKPGIPRDCNINTQLQSTPDSKRIYNFSYYHPSGNRGVISLSEDSVLVYIKHVHDITGRHFIIVVAPFSPNYPPSNYDSTTYYPKYIPFLTYALIDPPGAPCYLAWVIDPASHEYINERHHTVVGHGPWRRHVVTS